jgi:DNA polymerase-3 subunit epsilon
MAGARASRAGRSPPERQSASPFAFDMRQIFLDTETTGLSPESGDRVIELGCIEMVNRRLTGRHLHIYLNPERRNSEDAVKIHGLTDEFLADKPLFTSVADEFIEFVRDAEIIIHNAGFDVGFLNEELRRCGRPKFGNHVSGITDSLALARDLFPGKANSLDALCRRLEVDNTNRTLHGALLDAGLLAEVYIRLTRGQDSLVMELATETSAAGGSSAPIDLSEFILPVLFATESELAAHDRVLSEIDKASGGKTTWRVVEAAAAEAMA